MSCWTSLVAAELPSSPASLICVMQPARPNAMHTLSTTPKLDPCFVILFLLEISISTPGR
jgi:hypothetical protein